MNETWASPNGYDLHPELRGLNIPALVITGDHDFFPFAAEHIAQAIPGARLVTLKDCGHFPVPRMPSSSARDNCRLFSKQVVLPVTADAAVMANSILSR